MCRNSPHVRGTDHQTLHGDADAKSHEHILWQFLRNTEPLNDGEDETIEMDISEDLEQTLARAINGVLRVLGLPRPELERVGVALAKAHPKPRCFGCWGWDCLGILPGTMSPHSLSIRSVDDVPLSTDLAPQHPRPRGHLFSSPISLRSMGYPFSLFFRPRDPLVRSRLLLMESLDSAPRCLLTLGPWDYKCAPVICVVLEEPLRVSRESLTTSTSVFVATLLALSATPLFFACHPHSLR